MRPRFSLLLLTTLALLAGGATAPASAILNGTPDGDTHPYVGTMFTEELLCSGAAISPTVFLTADHCIEGTTEAYVAFDEDPQPRYADNWPHPDAAWTTGTVMQVGDFCGRSDEFTCEGGAVGFFGSSDVAVVLLDEPVELPRYAQLPEPDQVLTLTVSTSLTAVGYGGDAIARGGGRPQLLAEFTRKYAPTWLIPTQRAIDDVTVRTRTGGQSGTCPGDSGSPLLQGDTVLGVLSGGTGGGCAAPSYYSRVDNDVLPLLEALVD